MDFRLNGRTITLDAATVRTRVRGWPPDPIRTHWIQIDDQRWPPKQAFRIATGLTDEPFISHFAIRVFRKLGFETSSLPQETGDLAPALHRQQQRSARPTTSVKQWRRFFSSTVSCPATHSPLHWRGWKPSWLLPTAWTPSGLPSHQVSRRASWTQPWLCESG